MTSVFFKVGVVEIGEKLAQKTGKEFKQLLQEMREAIGKNELDVFQKKNDIKLVDGKELGWFNRLKTRILFWWHNFRGNVQKFFEAQKARLNPAKPAAAAATEKINPVRLADLTGEQRAELMKFATSELKTTARFNVTDNVLEITPADEAMQKALLAKLESMKLKPSTVGAKAGEAQAAVKEKVQEAGDAKVLPFEKPVEGATERVAATAPPKPQAFDVSDLLEVERAGIGKVSFKLSDAQQETLDRIINSSGVRSGKAINRRQARISALKKELNIDDQTLHGLIKARKSQLSVKAPTVS